MKLIEAINRIDALKPNSYSQPEKIGWISTLDGDIKKHIIDIHKGSESVIFEGYDEQTPLDTELLVPAPFDIIYLYWLQAQVDYWNQEINKYNNSMAMYNTAYSEYERYYNRSHAPIEKKFRFF